MAQPPSISTKPASSRVEAFKNWLKLKHYQFEVTFSVYTFTRGEKAFFCTFPITSLPTQPNTLSGPEIPVSCVDISSSTLLI